MCKIERPGIDGKWAKGWTRVRETLEGQLEEFDSDNRGALEYYVDHGVARVPLPSIPSVNPPYKKWEVNLGSNLTQYAGMRLAEFEIHGMAGSFKRDVAVSAFQAIWLDQFVEIHRHALFPQRFGRPLQTLNFSRVPYTAYGVVLGCTEHAYRLARLQLFAYRKGFYAARRYYPIIQFLLRILADFLNEPAHILEGDALDEPILNALFDAWRDPDPMVLPDLCLAACDYHTGRCKPGDSAHFYDFEHFRWTRVPVEILLLFKLREQLGLANPKIDHPLMNAALGVLPEAGNCEPDELLKRVRARMEQDGFDEEGVYQAIMSRKP